MSRTLLPIGLACVLACLHGGARAEVTLGVVSDYRYRGVSLTDGVPALQAGLAWDRDDGWYAGVFAANTRIGSERGLQTVSYLGHAWRLKSGRSWEAGVQYIALVGHRGGEYRELYLGLASDRWNVRLYHQPRLFGDAGPSAYAEANASLPLGGRWMVLGHVGAACRDDPGRYGDPFRYDGRVGVGVAVGAVNLHLQRVLTRRGEGYSAYGLDPDAADAGWVFGATWTW
ncbi:MAG TPA: TorF family putative porin [Xanthomonadaceae bacterium]|nr:TorF family putative porin [Xanthomonadaceae bacterium]